MLFSQHWSPAAIAHLDDTPAIVKSWLLEMGSTSKRLRKEFGHLSVQILSQKWSVPTPPESHYLDLSFHKKALVREVLLLGDHSPVMFGRSIFPKTFFDGPYRYIFAYLFHRPLGDLLFKIKGIHRKHLEISKLLPHHLEYQQAIQHYQQTPPTHLWARRSQLVLPAGKVMVMDILLPGISKADA